ncbi:hypothetical protein CHARACLAT_021687, partial [Characodon lateralis]|nr:hypothetical protein [Characodon lateralis]
MLATLSSHDLPTSTIFSLSHKVNSKLIVCGQQHFGPTFCCTLSKTKPDDLVNVMKMAAESFHLRTDDELQGATSLASLHLRDDVGIRNENTSNMEDIPEPNPALPMITSSPPNQSQQEPEIDTPADQVDVSEFLETEKGQNDGEGQSCIRTPVPKELSSHVAQDHVNPDLKTSTSTEG